MEHAQTKYKVREGNKMMFFIQNKLQQLIRVTQYLDLMSIGKHPGGSGAGHGVNSEGDPTVNAEHSNA
jgi:hypothetical protein